MPKKSMSLTKQFVAMLFFASPLISCGCSGGGQSGPTNIVKGKVTLNGQPVSGDVIFVSSDNKEIKTTIALNGEYVISNAPKGEYQVLVRAQGAGTNPPANDKTKMSDPSGGSGTLKGAEPPSKYAKPNNGLPKVDYKGTGEMKHDIELTQ
jgi:hypothetical protein